MPGTPAISPNGRTVAYAVTWLYHLHRGDYENWFRSIIRDSALANAAASIALRPGLTAQEGRALIRAAIEQSYSASALD